MAIHYEGKILLSQHSVVFVSYSITMRKSNLTVTCSFDVPWIKAKFRGRLAFRISVFVSIEISLIIPYFTASSFML